MSQRHLESVRIFFKSRNEPSPSRRSSTDVYDSLCEVARGPAIKSGTFSLRIQSLSQYYYLIYKALKNRHALPSKLQQHGRVP